MIVDYYHYYFFTLARFLRPVVQRKRKDNQKERKRTSTLIVWYAILVSNSYYGIDIVNITHLCCWSLLSRRKQITLMTVREGKRKHTYYRVTSFMTQVQTEAPKRKRDTNKHEFERHYSSVKKSPVGNRRMRRFGFSTSRTCIVEQNTPDFWLLMFDVSCFMAYPTPFRRW